MGKMIKCLACCCADTTPKDRSAKSFPSPRPNLQALGEDDHLGKLQEELDAKREVLRRQELREILRRKAEAAKEQPALRETQEGLIARVRESEGRELELRQLEQSNQRLREQIAAQQAKRLQAQSATAQRQQAMSELQQRSRQTKAECDSAIAQKEQMEKALHNAKLRLDAESNKVERFRAKENDLSRHVARVSDSSKSLSRRLVLLRLQVIWSERAMNAQVKALSHWRQSQ